MSVVTVSMPQPYKPKKEPLRVIATKLYGAVTKLALVGVFFLLVGWSLYTVSDSSMALGLLSISLGGWDILVTLLVTMVAVPVALAERRRKEALGSSYTPYGLTAQDLLLLPEDTNT